MYLFLSKDNIVTNVVYMFQLVFIHESRNRWLSEAEVRRTAVPQCGQIARMDRNWKWHREIT